MPARLVRRFVWSAGAVLILVALGSLILSVVAGRSLVQSSLLRELNELTGRRVVAEGAVSIRVFPHLEASIERVSLSDWAARPVDAPLLKADRMVLRLSPRAALKGIARIDAVELYAPVFHVPVRDGQLAIGPGGRITTAVLRARQMLTVNADEIRFAGLRGLGIGNVRIVDGRATIGAAPEVSAINGSFNWSKSNDQLSIDAEAVWNGETIDVQANIEDGVHLAAGRITPMRFNLESGPAQARLNGAISLKPTLFVDGSMNLAFPSGSRLSQWLGVQMPLSNLSGPVALEGGIKGSATSWTLSEAKFTLDNATTGQGGLALVYESGKSTLSGSLALSDLDLEALTKLVLPIQVSTPVDASNPRLDLDVRLSAARAKLASFSFTDVAASIQQSSAMTALDINNAEIYGGILQLAARRMRTPSGEDAEFRLLAEDIDGAALSVALPQHPFIPAARFTMSAILRSKGNNLQDWAATADGSLSLRIGPGRLNGMTLPTMVTQLRNGGFFQIKPVPGISMPIKVVEAQGRVEQGTVTVEKASIRPDDNAEIKLEGVSGLTGEGLALVGSIILAPGHALRQATATDASKADETLSFFVGGALDRIFVTPVISQPTSLAPTP